MAITNTNVTVVATAGGTAVIPAQRGTPSDPTPITVFVPPGAAPVYIGGPSVTTANGVPVTPGNSANFTLVDGDVLYGIVGTFTTTVSVMRGRA